MNDSRLKDKGLKATPEWVRYYLCAWLGGSQCV